MSDWREHLGDRRVVASISGGKDSAAMSLWLTEQGVQHDRVFANTGWEANSTLDYIRGQLTTALGPIHEVQSQRGGMVEWIRHKGTFPSRQRRWCTEELKVKPIAAFIEAQAQDCVNAVGIRADESEARSRFAEWEWSQALDCETWRPILRWSLQEVIDIHRRHGLYLAPVYQHGAERLGCWPCVFARKREVRLIADIDEVRIGEVEALEKELTARAGSERSWFQNPLGKAGTMPIRDVVQWSRTAHGGRQFELFAPEREEGCVRWGLCETAAKDGDE